MIKSAQDVCLRANFTSVLIVDDHPLFSEALATTLAAILPFKVLRTAGSLTEALDILASDFTPDAIVLDLYLPDVSGVKGLLRLKATVPLTPVVVVSAFGEDSVIASVMAAGAAGFVCKNATRAELAEAMLRIAAGDIYTPDGYAPPRYDDHVETDVAVDLAIARLSRLTTRQRRILDLVCEGKLNKQIAFELSIVETTVKAHVTAIMRKLGVHTRTQAAVVAKRAQMTFDAHPPEG